MHGFYIDTEAKQITFDIILDFSVKDRTARCAEIKKEIEAVYPDYNLFIALDVDLTD